MTNLDLPGEPVAKPPKNVKPVATATLVTPEALTEQPPMADNRARQGDEGRPFCELHQCLMVANGSGVDVTYYKCPVPGCQCKEKRVRPPFKMSPMPKECPQQTCREPQQYLQAALNQPSAANLTMVCPKCGFKMQQPRPHFRPRPTNGETLDAR